MPKKFTRAIIPPVHQADATLNQANPGSGTQYAVLATTRNVRIISIAVVCTWTVQPTPLEVHLTIDGNTITHTFTDPVSATWYYTSMSAALAELLQPLSATSPDRPFLYEGRSVAITAEITGGTVSNLSARVKYARW